MVRRFQSQFAELAENLIPANLITDDESVVDGVADEQRDQHLAQGAQNTRSPLYPVPHPVPSPHLNADRAHRFTRSSRKLRPTGLC